MDAGPRLMGLPEETVLLLLQPQRVLAPLMSHLTDDAVPVNVQSALECFGRSDWAELAKIWRAGADHFSRRRMGAPALRLNLAELACSAHAGAATDAREVWYWLAQRHRLAESFAAAEYWACTALTESLSEDTALSHVRAWREMSALREITRNSPGARQACQEALAIADRYALQPGVAKARIQALLQRSDVERTSGRPGTALETLSHAEALLPPDSDPLTRGLLELRLGNAHVALNDVPRATGHYERAEPLFRLASSQNNVDLVRIRRVACLRHGSRPREAVALARALADEHRSAGRAYRYGQALLELAEAHDEVGDPDTAMAALEEARHLLEDSDRLESSRWHRHLALLLRRAGRLREARRHVLRSLAIGARQGVEDVTRTMLALSDLSAWPEADVGDDARRAAANVALVLSEAARTDVTDWHIRTTFRRGRQSVYERAALVNASSGRSADAVACLETARTDVLHLLLEERLGLDPRRSDLPVRLAASANASAAAFDAARWLGETLAGRDPGPSPFSTTADLLPEAARRAVAAMPDAFLLATHLVAEEDAQLLVCWKSPHQGWHSSIRSLTGEDWTIVRRLQQGRHDALAGVSPCAWASLSRALLPPSEVLRAHGDVPLMISPDPRLWGVPYPALTVEGQHLVDILGTTLLPSLQTHLALRRRGERPDGDPGTWIASLDETLPGSDVERGALAALGWSADGAATEKETAPSHLGLYVSGHLPVPGVDRAIGVEGWNLQALASGGLPPLTILAGCWTGVGALEEAGGDVLSLAAGALLGGSRTVIAGIGHIGSQATALIASEVAARVTGGMAPGPALREAQRSLRDRYPGATPFDWAGLTVVGPWN